MMLSLKGGRNLAQFPESKRIFQKDGAYYDLDETIKQPELGRTLERIAKSGAKDFYEGETARILASEMQKNGGLITLDDLKNYVVAERKPLEGDYKGYHILTAPPPSSGGIGLLEMMGMLEHSGYEKSGAGSAAAVHYVAEVMKRYYADRNEYLGDPDFIKNPLKQLTDPAYLRKRAAEIDRDHATPPDRISPGLPAGYESTETTHYSIVDAEGNAVAVTYTLNGGYGSGVTVPGIGVLMNNEMDDFSVKPGEANMFGLVQGEKNAIAPGKRPLSSMTPTIVVKDNKPFLVVGAPGGSRIITAVMQVILNVIDFGMNIQEAVDATSACTTSGSRTSLYLEKGFSPDTMAHSREDARSAGWMTISGDGGRAGRGDPDQRFRLAAGRPRTDEDLRGKRQDTENLYGPCPFYAS